METTSLRQILFETCCKVFADAAFVFAELPEEDAGGEEVMPEGYDIMVMVDYLGPFKGSVLIGTGGRIAEVAAANMLGIEEDDPAADERKVDAVMELLNMICGNLLPAVAGPEPEFSIDAPRESVIGEFSDFWNKASARLRLSMEGCLTDVVLYIDDRKV